MQKKYFDIFLVLGSIWIIVGLIIYPNSAIWPMGFLFLLIGLIGRFGKQG